MEPDPEAPQPVTPPRTPPVILPDNSPAAPPAISFRSARRRLTLLGGGLALLAVCGMCAVLVGAAAALLGQGTQVTVLVSGEAYTLDTHARTVGDLLNEMKIAMNEGDTVSVPLESTLAPDMVVQVNRARRVTLNVDGDSRVLWTTATSPADILYVAGVTLGEHDRILIDGTEASLASLDSWPVMAAQITVKHALPLRINDSGQQAVIQTTDDTVGQALFDAGYTLYLADVVSPDINTPVTANLEVTIQRADAVTIVADGVTLQTRSHGATVADALADAGVALIGLDYAVPAEDTPLQPRMSINVIRVTEEVQVEDQPVAYETVFQADPSLELDQRQLVQNGQNGLTQTRIRVRYENGTEVSRTPEETVVVRQAQNEIIAYGTMIVLRTVDTPDGPREYWRRIRMYATSYHPVNGDNITGTGEILRKGIVAVVPGVIPYYTQVYVPDYGIGVVADSGGGLPNSDLWIDLGYGEDDYQSWHQYVDVYLLTPVPDRINYLLPE